MPNESQAPTLQPRTGTPKQVLAQYTRAMEMQRARGGEAAQPQPGAPAPSNPDASNPAPSAAAATPPVAVPAIDPTEVIAPTDPRYNDEGYWARRGRTTNGMIRAERDRSAKALDALRVQHAGQIGTLESRIVALQSQVAELQAKASTQAPTKVRPEDWLTPEQIEELGPDRAEAVLTGVARMVQKQIAEATEATAKPQREAMAQEAARKQQTAQQQFVAALDQGQPNWREVNASEDWKRWLTLKDEATGFVRDELLKMAEGVRDAGPILLLFKQFAQAQGGITPPQPSASPPALPSAGAQPGGAGPGPIDPAVGNDGEIMSRAQIAQQYTQFTRNKASDDVVRAFDARVKRAIAEGRVR